MCGISGVISTDKDLVIEALKRAKSVQMHRGPDYQDNEVRNSGSWKVGMSHQRLSILDLTDAGKQPMYSSSGESIIAYNGEVYNYKELNDDKLVSSPKTNTDTEIVLEMLEQYGVGDALCQFNGMWAFAWLDIKRKKLFLARDRVGIKPIYFTILNGSLFFSSEVKGVLESTGERFSLNNQVIGEYITQSQQDTTTSTFFNGIQSLPAGHYAEINLNSTQLDLTMHKYWDVFENTHSLDCEEAESQVKEIFHDAIKLRMRSDVPVGVTLSGGLDSSAIAVAMKELLDEGQELKILSAVSPGSEQDESHFIDIMGDYLKCDVHKVKLEWSPDEAIELMRKVTWHNDSPLGSFSNVAHYLLMKKAHELNITVILSGQGADELLCGYKKYLGFYLQSLLRNRHYLNFFKVSLSFLLNKTIFQQFNFQEAKRYLPKWFVKKEIDIRGEALKDYKPIRLGLLSGQSMQQRQASDIKKHSVPYLTHYEDRMSMAWSREVRLPFLDYRLIELLVNLPTSFKLKHGWTKYIFRNAMKESLPHSITWRKDKQGFTTPQEEWLRGELREQIEEIFGENALIFKLKLINRVALLHKYEKFCNQSTGKGGVWYRDIFNPLALEIWLETYSDYISFDD